MHFLCNLLFSSPKSLYLCEVVDAVVDDLVEAVLRNRLGLLSCRQPATRHKDCPKPCRSPPEQSNGNAEQRKKKRRKSCELKPEVFDEFAEGLPERLGDKPLRAIIVGTNPSGHAWCVLP